MKYLLLIILLPLSSFAITYNYRCGNDEGGCDPANIDSCVCVAADLSDQSICLTNDLHCVRPNKAGQCGVGEKKTASEANCLAMVWQSEAEPACEHLYQNPSKDICAAACTDIDHCVTPD